MINLKKKKKNSYLVADEFVIYSQIRSLWISNIEVSAFIVFIGNTVKMRGNVNNYFASPESFREEPLCYRWKKFKSGALDIHEITKVLDV